MSCRHVASLVGLVAVGALALAACGSGAAGTDGARRQEGADGSGVSLLPGTARSNRADLRTGDLAPDSAPRDLKERWVQLRVTRAAELDPVVVDGAGMTLYRFDGDTASPPGSTCGGGCSATWPPVTVGAGGSVFFTGVPRTEVGVVEREDGRSQVTVDGRPVYRYAGDRDPGDAVGHGVDGMWSAVAPDGRKAVPGDRPPTGTTFVPLGEATGRVITLFSGKDFDDSGGKSSTAIAGPGCKDVRGTFLSAVPAGRVRLWSEPGCRGTSEVTVGDVRDLAAIGFPEGPRSVALG
ncbi:COG4315 family predicted lipoprotein [Saccharothrix sp. Mg75]|uniref:COG4315 family predicted lipoprotein n=1 Tax=Saccharothrix sp. Mg75 TaxID=3445357 RepID=UPI003EEECA6F